MKSIEDQSECHVPILGRTSLDGVWICAVEFGCDFKGFSTALILKVLERKTSNTELIHLPENERLSCIESLGDVNWPT